MAEAWWRTPPGRCGAGSRVTSWTMCPRMRTLAYPAADECAVHAWPRRAQRHERRCTGTTSRQPTRRWEMPAVASQAHRTSPSRMRSRRPAAQLDRDMRDHAGTQTGPRRERPCTACLSMPQLANRHVVGTVHGAAASRRVVSLRAGHACARVEPRARPRRSSTRARRMSGVVCALACGGTPAAGLVRARKTEAYFSHLHVVQPTERKKCRGLCVSAKRLVLDFSLLKKI